MDNRVEKLLERAASAATAGEAAAFAQAAFNVAHSLRVLSDLEKSVKQEI